jgi:predicted permease
MTGRFRDWAGETHGANLELVRHFAGRFFDSDIVPEGGDWQKVLVGLGAAFFSAALVLIKSFMERYDDLQTRGFEAYRQAVGFDMISLIAIVMATTALLTLIEWQSLFPGLRDCLALAGLPVSPRQIFLAKFTALLGVFTVYVVALTAAPAILFAAITGGRWPHEPSPAANIAANFAATAGACAFVFFALLALQGVLLNLLPARIFARVSLVIQSGLFIATLAAVPLMGRQPAEAMWWPPVWFLRLREAMLIGPAGAATSAELALTIPPVVAICAYLLSYHRHRRILLEATPARDAGHFASVGSWLLERCLRDPRRQAAFAFMWKALARSRSHRLILMAYAGAALGWIVKGAVDMPTPSLRDQGMYGLIVVLAPLAAAPLVMLALRYLFSLPVELRANWIFRTLDEEGRAAWLAAVERFVLWCGVGPVFLASLPASIAILGPLRAMSATALSLGAVLPAFERLFRDWRKLPFTCSYVPGKQPVWLLVTRGALVLPLLGPAAQLILYCSNSAAPFLALFSFEIVLWLRWRAVRRTNWANCAICYEEAPEAAVMGLDLRPAEAAPVEHAPLQPAAEMFSGTLVASRGFLPRAWEEEIESERRSGKLLLETFLEDVRYGFRVIRRNPLLSAVVVLTLTIGIGINASVFTVVSGMALRPHVYRDPASFLRIFPGSRAQGTVRRVSYPEYVAYRDGSRSVRQLAAFGVFPAIVGSADSDFSPGMVVSCNFFSVDGLDRPILGRLINAQDCASPGQAPVAVISAGMWRQRFGSEPSVIGRVVDVNSRPVTIVGVVPDQTSGWTFPASIWMPYTAQTYFDPGRNFFAKDDFLWLNLAGRLAPGYTRKQTEAEFGVLAQQQDREHPGRRTAIDVTDGSWISELELTLSGRELMLLGFYLGAFNLVLFISCANVATLLLSRAAARKREIAVRLSLGASRVRLVRMLVTESLMLAAIAGALSTYLAWRLPTPIFHWVASRVPDFPMPPDWSTFAYIAAVVLTAGVLAGLAPALESLRVDLTGSLKGYGALLGAASGNRLRGLLVSAQVAMSMALLVGAGLFAHSEERTLHANPGYAPDRVVVAPLRFPENSSVNATAVRLRAVAERMTRLPGVRSVAFSDDLPMIGYDTVELRPPARSDAVQAVDIYNGSAGFLHTMGVPILRGRDFEEPDRAAAVASLSLARAFWPRQDPIGKTISLPGGVTLTIVGVARDLDPMRFGGSENPALYRVRLPRSDMNFMAVRFDSGAARAASSVRTALHEIEPNLFVIARRIQDWIDQITEILWNMVSLILILGIVATALATTGIYGAVSFAVNQRTRELGIRVALGARRLDIIREVLVSGGKPVWHGLLAGLWLSVATAAGLGQGVKGSPTRLDTANPVLYLGAAALLASAAVIAMMGPARRGSKADPLDALRCE